MTIPLRRKARELALQTLYQNELCRKTSDRSLDLVSENFAANKKALPYAEELIKGVCENLEALNNLIVKQSKNWRLDRMSVIDRNIMRICAYELCYVKEVPATVAINEALEIAKRFSTDDAPLFINGVLDGIRQSIADQDDLKNGEE